MTRIKQDELKLFYNSEYVNKLSNQTIEKNRRLLKYITLDDTDVVVDYACGDGRFASLVFDKVKEYYGVDFSEYFINKAKENCSSMSLSNVMFFCSDIIIFSEQNLAKFDKAFAFDFIEHIYDDEFITIFKAIFKSLKKGSSLYIHTPNADYFLELLKKKGVMKQFPEHVAVRNATETIKILKRVGFRNIEVKYIPHYSKFLKTLDFLKFTPLVGKYFRARLFIICKV